MTRPNRWPIELRDYKEVYVFKAMPPRQLREHVVKHLLGFVYGQHWDMQHWGELLGVDQTTLEDIRREMRQSVRCSLARRFERQADQPFENIRPYCNGCSGTRSEKCRALIGELADQYDERIARAIRKSGDIRRWVIETEAGTDRMTFRFLDSDGVYVVAKRKPDSNKTICVSAYRPTRRGFGTNGWTGRDFLREGILKVRLQLSDFALAERGSRVRWIFGQNWSP